ncbi:MAG TPA: fibronectin type III-like domain-contianing protein, partial [Ramlibacter sp.]|nr:fibronectin type III-like domain-contianing protein [Ramlibacter sp.]
RVRLAAGAAARIRFELPVHMLAFAGRDGLRLVEPGAFELRVGRSSADQPLRATVEVTGSPTVVEGTSRLVCEVRVEGLG